MIQITTSQVAVLCRK